VKLLLVILLIGFIFIFSTGCGSKDKKVAENNEKKSITIGVVLASATNPLYVAMEQGIRSRAEELNVNVRFIVAEEDQLRQINGVQDLITSKVDALIVSPISSEGAIVAYEAAKDAGIPIISVARSINRPDLETTYVGMNIVEDGRTIARWLAEKLGGKGKIAMLKGVAGASFTMDLEKGFKEVMAGYPEIQIVAEVNSTITKESGLKYSENFLTGHPDLNAIYGANDELALGAIQAAEAVNRLDSLLITGYNGVPAAIEAVKAGKLSMTTSLRPQGWGRLALETAVKIVNGEQVPGIVYNQTIVVDQEIVNTLKPEELR
jgi:ribose transport system substrate-binding protein